jgi:gluconokinase
MVVVLDLGSSSTRALCYDDRARLSPGAAARQSLDFAAGPDGRSEDDAGQAWQRVAAVLDALEAGGCAPARALAVSAYACSLLALDEDLAPLTPVYTYADTRATGDARHLRLEMDEMEVLQRTGCRVRANYWPARLAWLKRSQPDLFRRARWFVSLSDYLAYRLCGVLRAGLSVASWTGLVNRATLDWDDAWLDALEIPRDRLPPLPAPGDDLPRLKPEWRARWPTLADAVCTPALGDGAAANVGSGCVDAARIAVTIGSTAAARVVSRDAARAGSPRNGRRAGSPPHGDLPPELWAYRIDEERELLGGAMTEGGNVFAWLRRALRLPDEAELEREIAALPPDAHGLTVLPTFAGERSPGFADEARATLHGLSFDTTPAHIARACMEAIACRMARILGALRQVAPEAELVASGGALLASPAWRQMIADASGARLRVCAEPEATSRGAALVALHRLGAVASLADLPAAMGEAHEPDPARRAAYQAEAERLQALHRQMSGI